jgi:3',5'-cyclic AMP phosphodiesterase CpdA
VTIRMQTSAGMSGNIAERSASMCSIGNLFICTLLGSLLLFHCTAPALASVRIGIIGDQTGAADIDKSYAVLQQGVDALKNEKPDVVLHAGDLVESTQTPDEIKRRFDQATLILNQIPAPWYMTPGDHDVNPPVWVQNSPDRSREALFQQLYGALNPLVQKHLYYSFDVNNYHFVVLNSMEALDVDPRWGNVFYSGISDAQYEWLADDLATKAINTKGIIVLLHHPMWYVWSNWDRVHRLLARYPTRNVVAGHFHYNQIDSRIDNINYSVVGATGGDTKHGSPNAGDLQHVTMLTVNDDGSFEYRMIPLAPYAQIGWTSRQIMDRVQAQDSLLGNIYNFPTDSPVFLQKGALVAACGSVTPARLVLNQLGNADVRPVEVDITVTAPNMTVNGSFGQGMCEADIGPLSCKLNPSVNVAISDTSVVELSQYPVPSPLWTGTVVASNPPPPSKTAITVNVTLSFTANNEEFSVSKSSSTTVQPCN